MADVSEDDFMGSAAPSGGPLGVSPNGAITAYITPDPAPAPKAKAKPSDLGPARAVQPADLGPAGTTMAESDFLPQGAPVAAAPSATSSGPTPSALKPPSLVDQMFGPAGLRTMASGVPILGQGADYADAATNATLAPAVEPILDMIPGHDKSNDIGGGSWQDRYNKAFAMQRGMDASEHAAHPILADAQEIGGGILGGAALASAGIGGLNVGKVFTPATGVLGAVAPTAGAIPTMAANAIDGGVLGAGMGYLGGDGGLTDPSRLSAAGHDALYGGVLGAAVKPISMIGGAAWKAAGQPLMDRFVHPAVDIGASGVPASVDASVAPQPAPTGPLTDAVASATLAPSVTAPHSAVNAAYDKIFQSITRGGQSPEEAFQAIGQLGPWGMPADASVPVTDFARSVATAPGKGGQIAADALNLRQSGATADGQYVVQPSSQRVLGSLGESLGVSGTSAGDRTAELLAAQKAAAGPAYAKAYAAPPVPVSQLSEFSSSPQFTNAYGRARALSLKQFVPQADGSMKIQPLPQWSEIAPQAGASVPAGGRDAAEQAWSQLNSGGAAPAVQAAPGGPALDWRTLDLMKQGMDDMHGEGVRQGIGANEQRATGDFTKSFVAKLDSLNPDYATARAAFSGPQQSMDAVDAGSKYMSEDAPAVADAMAGLSPADQHNFRIGAVKAIGGSLGGNDTWNAALRAGVKSPNARAKLQQLFPDQQTWGDFHNMLQNENTMFETRARVLGGSQTDRNLVGQGDAGMNPLELGGNVVEAAHSPITGIPKLLAQIGTMGNGQKLSEPVANAAAGILFNTNNNAYPEFLDGLTAAARRAEWARMLAGGHPTAGGVLGYAASGATPQQPSGGVLGQ